MSSTHGLSSVTITAPALPSIPRFEDKWHSFSPRTYPSSPSYPPTPSTPRNLSIQPPSLSLPSTPRYVFPRRAVMPPAPPSSPRFEPVHSINARNLNDVCTFAPLALGDNTRNSSDSDRHAALTPGLSDSFSSSSSSSDEHDSLPSPRGDPYHASTTLLWDSYYTTTAPRPSSPTPPLYHLPSAKSCYDLGFGLPAPFSPAPPPALLPSPHLSPRPHRPAHHKSTPSLRRPQSHQKPRPRAIPDCFKDLPPPPPIDHYNAHNTWPPSRPAPVPPMPALAPARPVSPAPLSASLVSPRFSLFPACPPTRAARPLTAPCPERVVEKSVWEDDDDDEEVKGFKNVAAKLHIRSISVGNGKEGAVKGGSWGRKGGGKRSPGEVVRGLFGMR